MSSDTRMQCRAASLLSAKSGEKKAEHYDNSRSESCRSEAALKNETAELKDFSIRQLAALCVGYGPGIPFAAFSDTKNPETIFDEQGNPLTVNDHSIGTNGYVSPAIPEKGIHSIFYKDGPAGVGTGAWPTEMLISCSFNKELWKEFGNAVGGAVTKTGSKCMAGSSCEFTPSPSVWQKLRVFFRRSLSYWNVRSSDHERCSGNS